MTQRLPLCVILLPAIFFTIFLQAVGTKDPKGSHNAVAETGDDSAGSGGGVAKAGNFPKPIKCGLRFSGYVHNVTKCVTIFCNFILVSKFWALTTDICYLSEAAGGVGRNLFTMNRPSQGEKAYGLTQTVKGAKVIVRAPAVMVKLEMPFIPNDCFQSWLPVMPPQIGFSNVTVEGYKGNEPDVVIVNKTEKIKILDDQVCKHLFEQYYNPKLHFCIGHLEPDAEQAFIPPGAPIYGYYNNTNGTIFHDIVGLRWRVTTDSGAYFALCLRLYSYVQWIIDTINNDTRLATS